MTHRVHPYSFRLGQVRDWKSRWFDLRNYRKFLKADVKLRSWLNDRLIKMYVSKIEIERSPTLLKIIIHTSRPGLIIGRSGAGANSLKKEIEKFFEKFGLNRPRELQLAIEEIKSPETDAAVVSRMVAESLEKRLPFRRVLKQILSKVSSHKEVLGVKVALAGRLDGAEMSRREWLSDGRIPLQTIRADIDFARTRAHLPYGDIGIKVWIYKGEVFSEK
ncbi:MAG: 30S ribosomal protein S3 [Candidatus Niyogibacteria bacterium]|nr:MAG: 30S ribosomal protein S3 [Candidatus Niyogibacteria bacterium]